MSSIQSNYQIGHEAEKQAAGYLLLRGFALREMNWKTKYCEIDIVAQKNDRIYFVEVKYRKNNLNGTGLDYITAKKRKQMVFAAEMWVNQQRWQGEYCLAALEMTGQDFSVVEFLEDI